MPSRLPGSGRHSSGALMKASLSWLITPSRSRMTSFIGWRQAGERREERGADSHGEPGDVRDAVHRLLELGEQCDAVLTQACVFGHHHHAVEERIDRSLERGE